MHRIDPIFEYVCHIYVYYELDALQERYMQVSTLSPSTSPLDYFTVVDIMQTQFSC